MKIASSSAGSLQQKRVKIKCLKMNSVKGLKKLKEVKRELMRKMIISQRKEK